MIYFSFLKGKKVLLVSHELSITGAPLMLIETAVALQQSGADVAFVNLGFEDPEFPLPQGPGFRIVSAAQSFSAASEADLVIANTAETNNWVRDLLTQQPKAAQKLIWWIHEINTELYAGAMDCLREAAFAVFDSDACYQRWRQSEHRLPLAARVIHPCIHEYFLEEARGLRNSRFHASLLRRLANRPVNPIREQLRRRLGVGRDDFLVSLFGAYCSHKGHDLLTETVGRMLEETPRLPLKLLLVGFQTDEVRKNFIEQLSQSELAAVGPGRALLCVVDLKPYYLASDAFVMNSQFAGEAFGRVTIEAMAFGLPILGTDVGGTLEIVIDGVTGLLHPTGKEGQLKLSKNIRALLNSRGKASDMGQAGLKRVQTHFAEQPFYRDLAEVMQRALTE